MGLEPKITKNPDSSSDVVSIAATAAMKAGEALVNYASTVANAISSAAAGAADGSSKVLARPAIDADITDKKPRQTQDGMPEDGAIAKIVAEVLQERSLSVKRPDGINHATAGPGQILSVSTRSESLPQQIVRKSNLFESMERRYGSREEINTDRNSSKIIPDRRTESTPQHRSTPDTRQPKPQQQESIINAQSNDARENQERAEFKQPQTSNSSKQESCTGKQPETDTVRTSIFISNQEPSVCKTQTSNRDASESAKTQSPTAERDNAPVHGSKDAETEAKENSAARSLSCSKSTETPTQPGTQNVALKPTIQSIDDNNIQLCRKPKSDLRSSSSDAPDEENRKEVSRSFSPQLLEACSIEGKVRNQQTGKKENNFNAEQKQVCTPTRQPTAPGQTCGFLPPIRKDGDPLNAHKEKRESAVEKVEPAAATNSSSKDLAVSARVERSDTQDRGGKGEQYQGPTCMARTNRETTTNLTGPNNVISQAGIESTKSTAPNVSQTKQTDNLEAIGKGDPCNYKQGSQLETTTTTTTRTSSGVNEIKPDSNSCKNNPRTITDIDGNAIPIRTKCAGDNQARSDQNDHCRAQKNESSQLQPICPRPGANNTGQPTEGQPQPKTTASTSTPLSESKCTSGQGDLKRNSQPDQPAGDIRPSGSINPNSSNGPLEGTCTRKQPGQNGPQATGLPTGGDGPRPTESCHHNEQNNLKDQPGRIQISAQSNQSLERSPHASTSLSNLEKPAALETSVRQISTIVPERLSANASGGEIVVRATASSEDKVSNTELNLKRPTQLQPEASRLLERAATEPLKLAEAGRLSSQGSDRRQEFKSPSNPTEERAAFVNDACRIAQIVDQYFGRIPELKNQSKEQAITEIVRQLRDYGIIGGSTGLSEAKAIEMIRLFVQQREGTGKTAPSEAIQFQQNYPVQTASTSESAQQAVKQGALQQLLSQNTNTITWTYDQNGRWQAIRQGDPSTSTNPAKIPVFEQFGLRPDISQSHGPSKSDREQITNERGLPTKTNVDSATLAPTGQKQEEPTRHHQSANWLSPGGQKHQPISGEKADSIIDKRVPERSGSEEKPIESTSSHSQLVNAAYQPWVGIIGIPNLSGSSRTNDERGDKTGSANGRPQPTDSRRPDRRLRYIVQHGDTLESIALNKLGDSRFAGLILTINRSVINFMNQRLIRVPALQAGQILWLPSQLEVEIHRKHFFPTGKKPIPNPANNGFAPEEFDLHTSLDTGDSRQQPELVDVDPIQPPPALVLYDGEQPLAVTDHCKREEKSIQSAESNFAAQHLPTASPLSILLLRIRHTGNRTLVPLASTSPQKRESPLRRCWIVESGDSLRSIALKDSLMADSSMWRLIARINELPEYSEKTGEPLVRLQVGQEILLPNADEIAQFRLLQNLSGAARPELDASPALPAASGQASCQREIEARMLINKLSDCCRIMMAAPSNVSETFLIRLQATVDARWTTIAAYESRIGRTVRFTYNPDGSRTSFHMDLPAAVVKGMAEEDFKRNWRHYIDDFTDKNRRADGASAV